MVIEKDDTKGRVVEQARDGYSAPALDRESPTKSRVGVVWSAAGLGVAVLIAIGVAVSSEPQPAITPAGRVVELHPELVRQRAMTDTELLQDLADDGLIPQQAAPAKMTEAEVLQDLADHGLIPQQAVPRELTEAEMLQDLADHGLIPQQAVPSAR
jgi:hypothetical protein